MLVLQRIGLVIVASAFLAIGLSADQAFAQDASTDDATATDAAPADDTGSSADVDADVAPDTSAAADEDVQTLPAVEVVQKKSTAAARASGTVVPVSPVGSSTPSGPAATTGEAAAGGAGDAASAEGAVIDATKLPTSAHVTTAADFDKFGQTEPQEVLQQSVPGLILNDAAGSTFRSQVEFRGFSVGSLTGFPQGLAVYQNGTRINEVFGDTVFFDLIASNAISDMVLVTGNPVYGLNAIGGGLSILMKDGFNYQGTEIDILGGSHNRRQISVQHGSNFNNAAAYLAYEKILDDGYRDFSEANIDRFYGDFGLRGSKVEAHFNLTLAQSSAGVVTASPVELLAVDRDLTFTSPQVTDVELVMPQINASVKATDTLTLSGLAYYRRFRSDLLDGNLLEAEECGEVAAENGLALPAGVNADDLCSGEVEDGEIEVLEDSRGNVITEDAGEEPFGVLDNISQRAESWGGTLQAVEKAKLFGLKNQFLAGVSYDRGSVKFQTRSELGELGNKFVIEGLGINIDEPDDFAPRDVNVTTEYVGVYFSDTLELTDQLALTFGGRYNYAMVDLVDANGNFPNITSNHEFHAFNPNVGATYELMPGLTVYGSYAESNRAPTPGELACADPENPCPVESFLTDDPPLEQVETTTYEVGVKGRMKSASGQQRLDYGVGYFHALNESDILFTASPTTGRGFFLNAGDTLRQGIEANLKYKGGPWELYANYAYIRATFETPNEFSSPANPFAVPCAADPDANCVNVRPGDRIPGIPEHRFKAGVFYDVTPKWNVGATLVAASDQLFLGDEGNDAPTLSGYTRVDLHTSYKVTQNVELYGYINNVFDREYGLFGTFFEDDEASEVIEDGGVAPFTEFNDPRSVLPAPPVSAYGGLRMKF